jgi:hypothetical protein
MAGTLAIIVVPSDSVVANCAIVARVVFWWVSAVNFDL